jgi:hypothetical protein
MTLLNKYCRIILFFVAVVLWVRPDKIQAAPQARPSSQPALQNPPTPTPSPDVETQKIDVPPASRAQPATDIKQTGSLPAADVKALLAKVRSSEYRINDLLTDVHPDRWKLSGVTLESFNQTLKTLRAQVEALGEWRAQFEKRTDSLYLGFQTYAAINSVLPRLDGVARSIGEHETPGYAAQFSRAGDQLFNLQQTIGGYVGSLLHNQDQLLLGFENNLAACQQNLSAAMRGKATRATRMKNSRMGRPQRRSSNPMAGKRNGTQSKQGKKPN